MNTILKLKKSKIAILLMSSMFLLTSFNLITSSNISFYTIINYILIPSIFIIIYIFLLLRYDNFNLKKYKLFLILSGINLYMFFFDCIFGVLEDTILFVVKLNTLIFLTIFILFLIMHADYILKNNKNLILTICLITIEIIFIICSTIVIISSQKNLLLNNILINVCNTYYCSTIVNYLFIIILKLIPILSLFLAIIIYNFSIIKIKIKKNINLFLVINFLILIFNYLSLFIHT